MGYPATARHLGARILLASLLATLLALTAATPLTAQYFGRNKVQHRTFDFRVMRTEHFDIYFYPEAEEAARDAARMAERWYTRLSRILDHEFTERQPVILYANHPHFQQTTAIFGDISDGTGGVTEAFKQRVIMPFAHSYEETDHVLGHELVHAFQYDISGLGRAGGGIEAAAQRFAVPGWFVEGMAEYLSVGPRDALTAIWLRNAALAGDLPTIKQLTSDPRIFPYRYGHAVWAYIGGRWGDAVIGQILKQAGEGVPWQEAFQRILNISVDELSADWHASIRRAYLPLLDERQEAREAARALVTDSRGGGRLNLSPSVSPDGRWVAFLSELGELDVGLRLADAETGRVVRTLQQGAAFDAHLGSLRFIQSSGSWSPDGEQFALSALSAGQDVLVIIDVRRARRVRQYTLGIGEITSPTWSPDGRTIVFSGLSGGTTDLYSLDVASGEVVRLTDDRFADLQPTFSPDGRSIAFVTDRFGTDLEALVYGGYELATMELETRRIKRVPTTGASHNLNPQWSPDGHSLFFISNCSGIPNLYRVGVATGALARVTDLFSGVSGITGTSPALSVARGGERIVFTAFEEKGYNLYTLNEMDDLAGTPVQATECGADGSDLALLPPFPRPGEAAYNRVATALGDAESGLPSVEAAAAFAIDPYRPRLGLDYLGQPQVGVSVGGMFGGVGLYGGINAIFSDILGRHTVAGALQVQGQLDETGFAVLYLNTDRRLNYGLAAQRIPYVHGYYASGGAGNQFREQIVRVRYFDSSLQGYASYPLSTVQRLELGGGFRRIAQDMQVFDIVYRNGVPVSNERETLGGQAFNLLESSGAWVYDSSVSGYTGPIAGRRSRVELSPVLGQLSFLTALADLRHYTYRRPFTLALRGLHYGRYGRDGEGVFSDLYLGSPYLVRGYDSAYGNCAGAGFDCGVLNAMMGSRLAVGNAELRLPIASPGGQGLARFPLPIDAFAFADAGVAWTAASRPVFQRGVPGPTDQRGILTSAGFGARANLFGILVLEVDRVRAFESAGGWHWVFAIQPGF